MGTTIITCYHFKRANVEAFQRLLRTLTASLSQLARGDSLVLVANNQDGAECPDAVAAEVLNGSRANVASVTVKTGNGHCGSLNAGIAKALELPGGGDDDWIGCVQSSAILRPGWIEASRPHMADPHVGAIYGRIVLEEDPRTIWSDGHYVREGLIRDFNHDVPISESKHPGVGLPCLSASFWRRSLVQRIVDTYGNFVCENLPHYGDCTDVAHRATSVDVGVQFRYSADSVTEKRKPDWESNGSQTKIACSQLLAGRLYYRERADAAIERVARKFPLDVAKEANEMAASLLRRRYSPRLENPPLANQVIDPAWGAILPTA